MTRTKAITQMKVEFYEWLLGRLVKPAELPKLDHYFENRFGAQKLSSGAFQENILI